MTDAVNTFKFPNLPTISLSSLGLLVNGDICSPLQFNWLVCKYKAGQRKYRVECDKSGKNSVVFSVE